MLFLYSRGVCVRFDMKILFRLLIWQDTLFHEVCSYSPHLVCCLASHDLSAEDEYIKPQHLINIVDQHKCSHISMAVDVIYL